MKSRAILYVLAQIRDFELVLDRGVLDVYLLRVVGRSDWLEVGAGGDLDRAEMIPATFIGSEPSQEQGINNTRTEI